MATATQLTRHIQLLAALLAMELGNPLMAELKLPARILSILLFSLVCIAIFRAVPGTTPRRWLGTGLAGTTIALTLAHSLAPLGWKLPIDTALNVAAVAFFVLVLSIILGPVFSARQLRSDDVVGAFSGYIIIALIFGRLYTVVWMFVPDSFNINPDIQWQLNNWNTLQSLFDYFSFTTISSIGYGDMTTTRPVTNTLVWLEVMCGQFYMAVVVGAIVGMKLAQALSTPREDP